MPLGAVTLTATWRRRSSGGGGSEGGSTTTTTAAPESTTVPETTVAEEMTTAVVPETSASLPQPPTQPSTQPAEPFDPTQPSEPVEEESSPTVEESTALVDETPIQSSEASVTIQPPTATMPPVQGFLSVQVGGLDLDEEDYFIDENGNFNLSAEYIAALPDGEHVIQIESNGEIFESVLIMENGVPLVMSPFQPVSEEEGKLIDEELGGAWSLFDLLITQDFTLPMTIFDRFSMIFAIVVIVQLILMMLFRKKNNDENVSSNA